MADEIKDIITVSSSAFEPGENIPSKYTCDGINVNPPLRIGGIPANTKTLTLIVEDPDAPKGTFYHWVAWNIKPVETIKENSVIGIEGKNSFGSIGYKGPCPPSGSHRYFFRVFALDTELHLTAGTEKMILDQAIHGHVIATGELMGRYEKTNK